MRVGERATFKTFPRTGNHGTWGYGDMGYGRDSVGTASGAYVACHASMSSRCCQRPSSVFRRWREAAAFSRMMSWVSGGRGVVDSHAPDIAVGAGSALGFT